MNVSTYEVISDSNKYDNIKKLINQDQKAVKYNKKEVIISVDDFIISSSGRKISDRTMNAHLAEMSNSHGQKSLHNLKNKLREKLEKKYSLR